MVNIIFESHSTTIDNEQNISTGHYDVELSELGLKQSEDLGQRYENVHLDAIYCSDLQRSYNTGEIAFGNKNIPIIKDSRLRECDYGDLTQFPSKIVSNEKIKHLKEPFPHGESYQDCMLRMKSFLVDIFKKHKEDETIMIIGHRATQYGLNHWILGYGIEKCVIDPWKWQPGWIYELKEIV